MRGSARGEAVQLAPARPPARAPRARRGARLSIGPCGVGLDGTTTSLAARARGRRTGRAASPRAFAGGRSSRSRRSSSSAASSSEPSTRHSIRSSAASAASTAGRCCSDAEVRAQPRAQVARPADVEHLVAARRGTGRRRAASARRTRASASRARAGRAARRAAGGRRPSRAPRSCARPIRRDEDLRRRLRVGKRAVARVAPTSRRSARARRGSSRPARPPSSARASADRVEHRRREPPRRRSARRSRSRNARSKRALCATSTQSPAKARNRRIAASTDGRAAEVARRAIPVSRGDRRRQRRRAGRTKVWKVAGRLEPRDADGADLADLRRAGREAGRLEVDDDERRGLERQVARRRGGERDARRRATRAARPPRRPRRAACAPAPAGRWRARRATRAASSAGTGPRRSSTSSTSRSAASRRSCTPAALAERMFVYDQPERRRPPVAASRILEEGSSPC